MLFLQHMKRRKSGSGIPAEVKEQVEKRIETFNRTVINDPNCRYQARYMGSSLFLDRVDDNLGETKICRLKFTGDLEDWDFAIYRYSREVYDPDEWLFPGGEFVNGTLEGAMRAGLKAYPYVKMSRLMKLVRWFVRGTLGRLTGA